jgi:hypothetical protein
MRTAHAAGVGHYSRTWVTMGVLYASGHALARGAMYLRGVVVITFNMCVSNLIQQI